VIDGPSVVGQRGDQVLDARREGVDLGAEGVDLAQQHPRQLAVMIIEAAISSKRLASIFPRARSASRYGSRCPAIKASIMSRVESVSSVEASDDTLISASSSSFSSRCQ
jgi:hypothetical protein